ncbi:MAG: 4-hydroxyphenylpyruvate dioxygenase, partial [Deltaproteobacteria bacterium]|nr:4-hydroxyphenylpyruvate dioxygenase [Deltaproteobacteria bacterium]
MSQDLGIRGYDFVEFYVGSAKMVAYWYAKAFGFQIKGYIGPETGERQKTSYLLQNNNIKILLTSPLQPSCADVTDFLKQHGDGVRRWAMDVESVEDIYYYALRNGAIPICSPHRIEDKKGYVDQASIRIYDDVDLVFRNSDYFEGLFHPQFDHPIQNYEMNTQATGLMQVDHIVGNVRVNEMNRWAQYFEQTLNFETFLYFGPGDISTQYSALLSKVVRSRDQKIKLPINEPYPGLKKSQIEEFIQEYHGSGIQHIALASNNIISSIRALRANGVEFLSVPDTYYENLRKRDIDIEENIADLQDLGILCDIEGEGYLLQLFTKPIGDRPTFFFEVIQRCGGSQGFGHGNFQALFEAIERDQGRRG